jgi:D-3-phosphoglycerate dehydrogenase
MQSVFLNEDFSESSIQLLRDNEFKVLDVARSNKIRSQVIAIGTKVSKPVTRDLMEKFPNLRFILTPTTGTDLIDKSFTIAKDIRVISLRDDPKLLKTFYSTREIFLWLLISIMRNAHAGAISVEQGQWDRSHFIGTNLHGKRIGILGFGRIGKQIANLMMGLGCTVYAYDDKLNLKKIKGVNFVKSADELINSIDILSISIDDTDSNKSLINEKLLKNIGPDGIFMVNTARGFVVNELDILWALKNGKILGYGADVLDGEGKNVGWLKENQLWKQKNENKSLNIVITPHLGGATQENILQSEHSVVLKFLKAYRSSNMQ